jgi:uncharacterized membrane protein YbhN (UPF0104 family)
MRGVAGVAIRLLVSIGLLAFVLRGVDLAKLWDRVLGMHPGWVALALAAYASTMTLSVWRWDGLLRAQHIEVPRRRLSRSLWVSLFFNNFLPSNIGGDVIRIADTAADAGSKTLATTVVLVDRALGLLALLLVATAGAAGATLADLQVPGAEWLWMATGLGVAAAIPLLVAPQVVTTLLAPVRAVNRPWLTERAQRLEDAGSRFRAAPQALLAAFAGAVAVQVTLVGFYLLTARGLAIPLPVLLGAVLIPVSLAMQMLPVSINGFGVREAVFAFFFVRFGLPSDAAVALSLVSTGLVMALSLVGGWLFLTRQSGASASP